MKNRNHSREFNISFNKANRPKHHSEYFSFSRTNLQNGQFQRSLQPEIPLPNQENISSQVNLIFCSTDDKNWGDVTKPFSAYLKKTHTIPFSSHGSGQFSADITRHNYRGRQQSVVRAVDCMGTQETILPQTCYVTLSTSLPILYLSWPHWCGDCLLLCVYTMLAQRGPSLSQDLKTLLQYK